MAINTYDNPNTFGSVVGNLLGSFADSYFPTLQQNKENAFRQQQLDLGKENLDRQNRLAEGTLNIEQQKVAQARVAMIDNAIQNEVAQVAMANGDIGAVYAKWGPIRAQAVAQAGLDIPTPDSNVPTPNQSSGAAPFQPTTQGPMPDTLKGLGHMTVGMETTNNPAGGYNPNAFNASDGGGYSAGPYQLNQGTKNQNVDAFLAANPQYKGWITPQNPDLVKQQFASYSQNPDFLKAQRDFVTTNNYAPVAAYVSGKLGANHEGDPRLQEELFSLANKNGPQAAKNIFDIATKGVDLNSISTAELIQRINGFRSQVDPGGAERFSKETAYLTGAPLPAGSYQVADSSRLPVGSSGGPIGGSAPGGVGGLNPAIIRAARAGVPWAIKAVENEEKIKNLQTPPSLSTEQMFQKTFGRLPDPNNPQDVEWQRKQAMATTPQPQPEDSFNKAIAENDAKRVAAVFDAGDNADKTHDAWATVKIIDPSTGAFAPEVGRISNMLMSLGVDPQSIPLFKDLGGSDITKQQEAMKQINNVILQRIPTMHTRLTNNELNFLQTTLPQITNQKEAFNFLINSIMSGTQQEKDKRDFYRDYQDANDGKLKGVETAWQKGGYNSIPTVKRGSDGTMITYQEFREQNPSLQGTDAMKAWKTYEPKGSARTSTDGTQTPQNSQDPLGILKGN